VISKSAVNRAGESLRAQANGTQDDWDPDDATALVDIWRQAHSPALGWVTEAVGRRLSAITGRTVVAQRLKRMPQIKKKLARYDKMNLARMQDIGGCRAILATPGAIDEVEGKIRGPAQHRWPLRYRHDYREDGKPHTGYRALHLVVEREGYLIEIQLRTMRQHAWAEAVERATSLSDHNVKEGRAPDEILEYFRLTSDGFWTLDCDRRPTPRHVARCRRLHRAVERYLQPSAPMTRAAQQ
jgi:GTP pyrophosphokinase